MQNAVEASGRAAGTRTCYAEARSAASLSTLVYRSQAVQPFSQPELLGLTTAAQQRNRSESITGLVLYDDSRFFQWLEGPEDSLSRVMQSINNDRRHTAIEVMTRQRTRTRTFAGWDMKLALPGAAAAPWTREVITPSAESLDALRRRPEIAASILERLAPGPAGTDRVAVAAILEQVIRTRVIPQLVERHAGLRQPVPTPSCTVELTTLALRGDAEAAVALLLDRVGATAALHPGAANPLLAAARQLGDRWSSDACSEGEVLLGMVALQTVVRWLERDVRVAPRGAQAGVALVAPFPGEPHGLQAALAAHALRRAGWAVRCEFPASDSALEALVAAGRFDMLHLSLSAAFRREERMAAVATTIAAARRASRPALTVKVGGRLFAEQPQAAGRVGADRPERSRQPG